jgi:tetratricopeptide (TPR) repeat protein
MLRGATIPLAIISILASTYRLQAEPALGKEVEQLQQTRSKLLSEQRFPEALQVTRSLLNAYERTLGTEHWRCKSLRVTIQEAERLVTLSSSERADLFRLKSRIEEANKDGVTFHSIQDLARCREQVKELLGKGPVYRQLTEALLVSHYLANDITRAHELALDLEETSKSIGVDSPEYGAALTNLGFVLTCRGQLKEADDVLQNAAAANVARYGTGGLPFLDSVNRLAYLKLCQGEAVEALLLSGAAVSGYPRAMKTEECKVASALFTWGMANAILRQNDEARKALRRFTELSKDQMVPNHPFMLEAASQLKSLGE